MPSLISQIADWGTTLPYWEQVALERIINGQDFTDVVYSELLQFLLEDANLSDRQSERPKLRLKDYVRSDDSSIAEKPILHQISNLQNINALVPNQRLEFGKKATVIFGDNGSGKSGYARVIASAAFTRGDKDISRNIKEPFDEASPRCADFYSPYCWATLPRDALFLCI